MKVIAKTENGCLIEASNNEIKEILTAVNGAPPDKVEVGRKIPAIDYASTIKKIQELKDNYHFNLMLSSLDSFNESVTALAIVINQASAIKE